MPLGRPTKYTPELLEEARGYLDGGYREADEVVPTIAGLSLHVGISRETCYAWSSDPDKQDFSDIVGEVMAQQERGLLSGGLRGDYNSTITKLMLTKHNYSDKQETTADINHNFSNMTDDQLQAIVQGETWEE